MAPASRRMFTEALKAINVSVEFTRHLTIFLHGCCNGEDVDYTKMRTIISILGTKRKLTILLSSPPATLKSVVTERKRPLRVLSDKGGDVNLTSDPRRGNLQETTYMLPASVVGGARKSGFCWSSTTFSGPMMLAPRSSLIASGVSVVSCDQAGSLGKLLAGATVAEAGRKEADDEAPKATELAAVSEDGEAAAGEPLLAAPGEPLAAGAA